MELLNEADGWSMASSDLVRKVSDSHVEDNFFEKRGGGYGSYRVAGCKKKATRLERLDYARVCISGSTSYGYSFCLFPGRNTKTK